MNQQTPKLNSAEIITKPELETLIESLVFDTEFHPYTIYGLMFLFSSIRKLALSNKITILEQIWTDALVKLYSLSPNVYKAIDHLTKNIHLDYRAADFTKDDFDEISAPFLKSERGEITHQPTTADVLDLSDSSTDDLAQKLSDLMNDPNVPSPISDGISQVLTDFFNDSINQTEFVEEKSSPDYIARLLRAFPGEQNGGGVMNDLLTKVTSTDSDD